LHWEDEEVAHEFGACKHGSLTRMISGHYSSL
jgi:hypothetical protein